MAAILSRNAIAGEKLLFKHLMHRAYRGYKTRPSNRLLEQMILDGVVQMDALLEKTISQIGKLRRTSGHGKDFDDGSDAKKTTTYLYPPRGTRKSARRRAKVSKIQNKRGVLRVAVAETASDKVYYFVIPYRAYRDIKTITFYFDEKGSPIPGKWWQYQVKGLKELSK